MQLPLCIPTPEHPAQKNIQKSNKEVRQEIVPNLLLLFITLYSLMSCDDREGEAESSLIVSDFY